MFYGTACLLLNTVRTAPRENANERARCIRARYMKAVAAKKVERYGYERMAAAKTYSTCGGRMRIGRLHS